MVYFCTKLFDPTQDIQTDIGTKKSRLNHFSNTNQHETKRTKFE